MARIVVLEDDAGTRTLITSVLRKDDHEVLGADNGADGLDLIRAHGPDLVISDVQMPRMDGFELLARLRADPATAELPVIVLTSLQERAHMRIGMTTGADDYITKPFRPGELREAVAAQLNRRDVHRQLQEMAVESAVKSALAHQAAQLSALYEQRLAKELSDRWPSGDGAMPDEQLEQATVLFVDIMGYAALAEQLAPDELADVIKRFYLNAGDTAHLFGAHFMQFVGDGLLLVFADKGDTRSVTHGLRGVRAALGLVDAARRVQQHLDQVRAAAPALSFRAGVALHDGPVALARLSDPLLGSTPQTFAVGAAVTAAMQLQRQAQALGWPVAASVHMLRGVVGAVRTGRRALLSWPGHDLPVDTVEITGLVSG